MGISGRLPGQRGCSMSRFALFGLLLCSCVYAANAKTESVFVGNGQAVIIADNRSAAENIARASARSSAIVKAMEAYVADAQVDRHQFNLKKGAMLRAKHDFVVAERVLSTKIESPILKMQLRVEVDSKSLALFFGSQGLATAEQVAKKSEHKPTVMIVMAEEINGALNRFPYSQGRVNNQLLKADYLVVDTTAAARASKHDQAVQSVLNHDLASARAIALQFDAHIVISGRAVAQKSGISGGGMNSYGANVALTAVASDSGRVLASASGEGMYPHVNAITGSKLALEEAAGSAIDQILAQLKLVNNRFGSQLRMTISGVNYQQLSILKRILQRDFPDLTKLSTLGFTGDVARLNAELAIPVVDFSEALARKKFGGFRLKILSQSAGKLDVVVVKKSS
ncbi:MAG: hypothetical protein AB8B81_06950 [Halioglobus sp.]